MSQANASRVGSTSGISKGVILILIGLAALTALVWLTVYPFISTADGMTRISEATGIPVNLNVLAPLQGRLIWLSVAVFGTVDAYMLAQIFVFYSAVFVGYRAMLPGLRVSTAALATAATLAFPAFLLFPVILTDSAIVFAAMAWLSVLLTALWGRAATPDLRLLAFLAFTVVLFFFFGMRMNAIIVAPAILALVWVGCRPFSVVAMLGITVAIAAVALLNGELRRTVRPEALGMGWEIVGVAKQAPDALGTVLDFCGDTRRATELYHVRYLNPIFWNNDPPLPAACIVSLDGAARVRSAYFDVIASHSSKWARVKAAMWLQISGVRALQPLTRGIHDVDAFTQAHGGRPGPLQDAARSAFYWSGDVLFKLPRRPFLSTLLALLGIAAVWRSGGAKVAPIAIPVLIGNLYYAGFFINAQAAEFRYFAPTFFLNTMSTVAAATLLWTARSVGRRATGGSAASA